MIKLKALKKDGYALLAPEIRLLDLFDNLATETGEIDGYRLEDYEKEIGVSHTTMKKYLHTFEAAGVLKFRYNGRVYFNPDVRDVAAEFRRDADISYKMFMSD